MSCQLMNMHELTLRNSLLNNLFQFRIKLIWSTKKRVLFLKNKLSHSLIPKSQSGAFESYLQTQINPGDMVKVYSKEEIRNILDDWGASQGCVFTPEMYKHCDKIFKVYKRVEYFYDEVKQKMCKCKNIVLLEGAFCSGRRKIFSEDCDRNCFQFWHVLWLKKVE